MSFDVQGATDQRARDSASLPVYRETIEPLCPRDRQFGGANWEAQHVAESEHLVGEPGGVSV